MSEKLRFRTPDIESRRRALNPESGKLMLHSVSRHVAFDTTLVSDAGNNFGQGTLFPRHVKPGDITKIERAVADEFHKLRQGEESKIRNCFDAGGAFRITMELRKYGVEEVGSFIRDGQVCTVFPEKNRP